tara:strand:+ start:5958 stop:8435 length:2478 start_codon:yes stop_codon:yes gene_type:complete
MQKISTHGIEILVFLLFWGIGSTPFQQTHAAEPKKSLSENKKVLAQNNAPQNASAVPSRALLDRYCVTCHNERLKTAGLVLDQIDFTDIPRHAEVLEKVVKKLRAGQMPPEGRPKPDSQTVEAFLDSLESALDQSGLVDQNPGRVASRRMNRVEYVNAVQDLLGLEINGSELLPSDMAGFGFDNNADVLAMTPALMARYIAAATKISRAALGSLDNRPMRQVYSVGFELQNIRANEDMPFATLGGLSAKHIFPLDGEYTFAVRLKRNQTVETINGIEEDEHEIELRIDHELISRWKIGGKFPGPDPGVLIAVPEDDKEGQKLHEYRMTADDALEIRLPVKAGQKLVSVAFTDSAPSPHGLRGKPGIDKLFISGPFDGTVPETTPTREKIFTCRPDTQQDEESCATEIITTLARRAYRRPVTSSDVDPLLSVYRQGNTEQGFDGGIERAVEALLSMPGFLFRVEREPVDLDPGQPYEISDLELASRLSFFLWRSIPDDELIDLAAAGNLSEPDVLATQVKRMLADQRATRFMNDFVGQWLQVRNIDEQDPDGALFAQFNDTLRKAMARETQLFFESQVREDRSISELLTADYTFLNEQLARHYGIQDIYGSRFRRTTWKDDRRHGLLGHASLLTVTSYANRTSVVLRGKWVLETILGAPPPPPPPNVPPLEENDGTGTPTSLRDRMEQHRSNPVCASCHAQMDPLGFAMEHFDAIGRWREHDNGATINASIEWDNKTIENPRQFREALAGQGTEFIRTVAEKLLTYGIGRGLTYHDGPIVRDLVRNLEQNDRKWSSLILGVVNSGPFRMRTTANETEVSVSTVAAR